MKRTLIASLLAVLTLGVAAQSENPRGIYMMTTLTGNLGEVKAPYEQYKICTDTMTLMVSAQNNTFSMTDNDHDVFYYTGDQPKSEDDKSTTHQVKWLTKNRIAIDDIADYRIDWIIVERVTDGISPLSRIASQYISNRRR